jgi:hypothetical protein
MGIGRLLPLRDASKPIARPGALICNMRKPSAHLRYKIRATCLIMGKHLCVEDLYQENNRTTLYEGSSIMSPYLLRARR